MMYVNFYSVEFHILRALRNIWDVENFVKAYSHLIAVGDGGQEGGPSPNLIKFEMIWTLFLTT